jgi:hypothetical protein
MTAQHEVTQISALQQQIKSSRRRLRAVAVELEVVCLIIIGKKASVGNQKIRASRVIPIDLELKRIQNWCIKSEVVLVNLEAILDDLLDYDSSFDEAPADPSAVIELQQQRLARIEKDLPRTCFLLNQIRSWSPTDPEPSSSRNYRRWLSFLH